MPLRYIQPPAPTDVGPGGSDYGAALGVGGSMVATWTAPDGTEWPLTDTTENVGWFTRQEIAGWAATTYEIVTDPNARGGESVRHIRSQPARVTWPLHIWGDSHQQFVERERTIKRAFTMTLHRGAPGTLRVARPDGSAREIDCYYEEGFGGQAGEHWVSANPVLTLYAPDGYWRDVEATVARRSYASTSSFYSPFLTISSSNVLGATTITNPGDVTAWPVWTITGPCTAITATNVTTGQSFTLNYTLLAGETITITTNRPTVRGPAGQNIVTALDWPSAYLWGLTPEDNAVQFVVAGSANGTAIELAFHARYEGA